MNLNEPVKPPQDSPLHPTDKAEPTWLSLVREQIEQTQFGTIQITVHNGRVTKIEKTEKLLLDPSK
jgi:hypothetical protein